MTRLEERLEKIERLLELLLARLEKLEEMASLTGREAGIAAELALAFSLPAQRAIQLARTLARLTSLVEGPLEDDGLSKAILEALLVNGPLTLRGLEREVRRIRGSATRSRIRRRLRDLEELGLVVVERRGNRMVIRIAEAHESGGLAEASSGTGGARG